MTSALHDAAEEQWLEGGAGRILTRFWAAADPRAVLVICHGVKAHGGQYDAPARAFAARGLAVTALDLRGRGRSDGARFYADSVDDYVADLSLAIEAARARHPDLPLFLLGHSAGGVTAATYALDHQDRLHGLICESFAFRVYAPDFALKLMQWLARIAPRLPVLKLHNRDFSRDPAWVATLDADPLTRGEVQPVATVAALARAAERLNRDFGRITLPLLILHGSADKVTRPDGSQQFFDQAGSPDKSLKLYQDHVHDLLADYGKEQVIADIAGWIDAHLPNAPDRSGFPPSA